MRNLILITLLGVLAIGCKEKPKSIDKFDPNAAVSVDISIISNQSVPKLIEVNGSVISSDFVELRPEINGRVTFLQIPEGKVVSAGTVLVKLNDADLQAQLEKIKVQLELAQTNEQRNKQLLSIKGINQSDYDVSLQQVKSYKADMAYTQSLIDKTVIKAPFSGQLGLRQISLGAFINTATTVVTLQKTDDLKIDFPENGNLERWANQGVLLLNSILTVDEGSPNSHKYFGWEQFTDAVIHKISTEKSNIVFLLWGTKAIAKKEMINCKKHLVLTAPHPSPLSAYRGFFGCKHFSQTNQYFRELGITEINW